MPDPGFWVRFLGERLVSRRWHRAVAWLGGGAQPALGLTVHGYCPHQAATMWGFNLATLPSPALTGSKTPVS